MNAAFTADVVGLLTYREKNGDRTLQEFFRGVDEEEAAETLRKNLMAALAPEMTRSSGFVQQVVWRALVDHVDWVAVAARVKMFPQDN